MIPLLEYVLFVVALFIIFLFVSALIRLSLYRRGFVRGVYVKLPSGDFALVLKIGLLFAYVELNGELVKVSNFYLLFSHVIDNFRI